MIIKLLYGVLHGVGPSQGACLLFGTPKKALQKYKKNVFYLEYGINHCKITNIKLIQTNTCTHTHAHAHTHLDIYTFC